MVVLVNICNFCLLTSLPFKNIIALISASNMVYGSFRMSMVVLQ